MATDRQDVTLVAVQQALGDALLDQKSAGELLANPAAFFKRNDLDVSQGEDAEFNQYFQAIDEELQAQLSNVLSGQRIDAGKDFATRGRLGCWSCKAGVWSIAASLAALGAVAVVALTPEDALILALSRFLGLEARAVASFVTTLGSVVQRGVSAVANAICRWVHAC